MSESLCSYEYVYVGLYVFKGVNLGVLICTLGTVVALGVGVVSLGGCGLRPASLCNQAGLQLYNPN